MAGRGTRLRPFTLTCPKPLLKIIDKPIVEHLIDQITSNISSEIDEIIYILGDESYFNTDVVSSLKLISDKYKAKTKIYRQLDQLGTGHAIMCAEESLRGPSIIAYADTIIHGKILIDSKSDGIIWVKKVDNPSSYGVVNLDKSGNIQELVEKPKEFISDLAVVGIYYFKDISLIRDELKVHLSEKLSYGEEYLLNYGIEKMIEKKNIFKSQEIDSWMDCGTPNLLLDSAKKIMKVYKNSLLKKDLFDGKNVIIKHPVFIGDNVKIQNSTIGPYVSIGDNTVVNNSFIDSSIIYNNTSVDNANISNSIVGSNTVYNGNSNTVIIGDYSQIKNNAS